jgi:hypothetical protein
VADLAKQKPMHVAIYIDYSHNERFNNPQEANLGYVLFDPNPNPYRCVKYSASQATSFAQKATSELRLHNQ